MTLWSTTLVFLLAPGHEPPATGSKGAGRRDSRRRSVHALRPAGCPGGRQLRRRAGPGGRLAGPERRRQIDDHENPDDLSVSQPRQRQRGRQERTQRATGGTAPDRLPAGGAAVVPGDAGRRLSQFRRPRPRLAGRPAAPAPRLGRGTLRPRRHEPPSYPGIVEGIPATSRTGAGAHPRPAGGDSRRAYLQPRPAPDSGGAAARPRPRRRRQDGVALHPHSARSRGHRRPSGHHQPGAHRRQRHAGEFAARPAAARTAIAAAADPGGDTFLALTAPPASDEAAAAHVC